MATAPSSAVPLRSFDNRGRAVRLTEEEMVALPGDFDLRDGMAVQIVNTDVAYLRGKG